MVGSACAGGLIMSVISLGFSFFVIPWILLQPHAMPENSAGYVQAIFIIFTAVGIMGLWLMLRFMRLFGRKTPLFRLDENGITDYGMLTSGYGLIKWQNIESIAEISDRGTWLLLKVNNFNQLLNQRSLLLRPILAAFGAFYGMFGGQIYLPLPYGKATPDEIKTTLAMHGFSNVQNKTAALIVFSMTLAVSVAAVLILVMPHRHTAPMPISTRTENVQTHSHPLAIKTKGVSKHHSHSELKLGRKSEKHTSSRGTRFAP